MAEYDRRRPAAQAVESEYDRRRPAAEAVEPEYERRRPPALELSSEYVGRGPATVEAEPEYVRPRREDFTTKQRTRVPAYDPRESTEYHQQQQINHWTGYDLKEQDSHLLFDDVQHQTNSVENVYVTPKPANAKRRKKNGAQELKKYAKKHIFHCQISHLQSSIASIEHSQNYLKDYFSWPPNTAGSLIGRRRFVGFVWKKPHDRQHLAVSGASSSQS